MRRLLALSAAALFAAPAPAQPTTAANPREPATGQIQQEVRSLSHPALMAALESSVGKDARQSLRLTGSQSRDILAAHTAFEQQVKDFVRSHAKNRSAPALTIPNPEEAERRIRALLTSEQRTALDSAVKAAASKRDADQHSSHQESADHHSDSSSQSSHQTSSSHQSSSQSSHQSASQSSHDAEASKDTKASKNSKSGTGSSLDKKATPAKDPHAGSGHADHSHTSAAHSTGNADWSSLNDKERRAVVAGLLDQLSASDREALAKELGMPPRTR